MERDLIKNQKAKSKLKNNEVGNLSDINFKPTHKTHTDIHTQKHTQRHTMDTHRYTHAETHRYKHTHTETHQTPPPHTHRTLLWTV